MDGTGQLEEKLLSLGKMGHEETGESFWWKLYRCVLTNIYHTLHWIYLIILLSINYRWGYRHNVMNDLSLHVDTDTLSKKQMSWTSYLYVSRMPPLRAVLQGNYRQFAFHIQHSLNVDPVWSSSKEVFFYGRLTHDFMFFVFLPSSGSIGLDYFFTSHTF